MLDAVNLSAKRGERVLFAALAREIDSIEHRHAL